MHLEPKKIGAFLREQRIKLAITQAELAERVNVSAQSVSNWERGESLPDIALLPDLASILDCSIDAMLGGGNTRGVIVGGSPWRTCGRPSPAWSGCARCWARITSWCAR